MKQHETLLQWLPIREKIFKEFPRAETDEKRATLLQVFKATMDIVEEHVAKTQPHALKGFREARNADYQTLVVMGMATSTSQKDAPRHSDTNDTKVLTKEY